MKASLRDCWKRSERQSRCAPASRALSIPAAKRRLGQTSGMSPEQDHRRRYDSAHRRINAEGERPKFTSAPRQSLLGITSDLQDDDVAAVSVRALLAFYTAANVECCSWYAATAIRMGCCVLRSVDPCSCAGCAGLWGGSF